MKYVWDENKNRSNQKKHFISFEEAQALLEIGHYVYFVDTSKDEERFMAIGLSPKARILTVIYLYREEDLIRIVSARKATKKERIIWEREKK